MTIDFLTPLIGPGMAEVDAALKRALDSRIVLIRQIADYIIGSGGKRLRPALLLLAAGACGHAGREQYTLAAVIEMIHTATLLHDDVVDESAQRRGRATANAAFGNAAAVLVGDFLYSRAFQMMVEVDRMAVLRIVADATNVIAEGEVMQLMNTGNAGLDEDGYLSVIHRKTAKLFEAAAHLGAVLGECNETRTQAFARYGLHVGTAFQIMDDVLDYSGDVAAIGKNLGDDLAEGKMTLPLIRALAVGSEQDAATIRHAIEGGGLTDFAPVLRVLESTGALAYARERAAEEGRRAAACIADVPASPYLANLLELAAFAANRRF